MDQNVTIEYACVWCGSHRGSTNRDRKREHNGTGVNEHTDKKAISKTR